MSCDASRVGDKLPEADVAHAFQEVSCIGVTGVMEVEVKIP